MPLTLPLDLVALKDGDPGTIDLTKAVSGDPVFSTVVPGGYASMTLELPGDPLYWRRALPKLTLVRAVFAGVRVFEGQVEDHRLNIASGSLSTTVTVLGLQNRLKETSARRIWVKRDLGWQPIVPGAGLLIDSSALNVATGAVDPTNLSTIGVRVGSSGGVASAVTLACAGAWIAFPAGLATQLLFDLTQSGVAANWSWLVDWSADGSAWTNVLTQSLNAYAGGSFNLTIPASATQIRVYLKNATGGTAALAASAYGQMANVRLLGATAAEDAAGGLYGGTILTDLIQNVVTELTVGNIESGSDFLIQACERQTRAASLDVVSEVNSYYAQREWAVWEDATFQWVTVNFDAPQWIIDVRDIAEGNLTDSAPTVPATVYILYQDAGTDLPMEAKAVSANPRNPYVKTGRVNDMLISPGFPMTPNTSAQLAAAEETINGEHLLSSGDVQIPVLGLVTQAGTGGKVPAILIRAGDNVLVTGLPRDDPFQGGRDGQSLFHVASTEVRGGYITLTLDTQLRSSDVLLARLAAVTKTITG